MFRDCVFTMALACVVVSGSDSWASTGTIHESAGLGPTGQVFGPVLGSSQFLGSRFHIDAAVRVEAIGGHLTGVGTFYAALVALASPTALPSGAPFDDTLRATTVFTPPLSSADVRIPLSVELPPGDYALIFGSGRFGAAGHGFMLNNNVDVPQHASYFIWTGGASGGSWHELSPNPAFKNMRFVVEGATVPEPAGLAMLVAVAACTLGVCRPRVGRRSHPLGLDDEGA